MKFQFVARCDDQLMPIDVEIDYKPGKQAQRARRIAVGKLLAVLEVEQAQIDASGDDRVIVQTESGTWVIAEGGSVAHQRGAI